MDPRLVDAVAGCVRVGGGPHVEQFARRVAAHPEHGIHDRDVGDAQPVQQDRDGVHQHRALVGDQLERGPETAGVVGAVHRDLGLADRCAACRARLCAASIAGDTSLPMTDWSTGAVIAESAAGASPCGP